MATTGQSLAGHLGRILPRGNWTPIDQSSRPTWCVEMVCQHAAVRCRVECTAPHLQFTQEEPCWHTGTALQEMSVNLRSAAVLCAERQPRPPLQSARPVVFESNTPSSVPLSLISSVVLFGLARY
ncbi:hypothetical protein J1614_002675 [Plenodomus biglobosus]|nr:hypothetical protein J1614_002675 [Plenodomus biglobosus]